MVKVTLVFLCNHIYNHHIYLYEKNCAVVNTIHVQVQILAICQAIQEIKIKNETRQRGARIYEDTKEEVNARKKCQD
jgi:uncharacterized protein YhbP (UPF0306 family)